MIGLSGTACATNVNTHETLRGRFRGKSFSIGGRGCKVDRVCIKTGAW
jgi:hypothetical protein